MFNKNLKFYQLKKNYILIILVCSLLLTNTANATNYEFNNLVVFGDSISDGGRLGRKSRYIAGGFDSKMYNDYLSVTFSGKKLIPFTFGGTNYAVAGSKANSNNKIYSKSFSEITNVIDSYIAQNNGKIDPNNLYVLFIGGNDVTDSFYKYYADLTKGIIHDIQGKNFTINNTPTAIANNAKKLFDAGAKYILITNIFDAQIVPINIIIPAVWIDTILGDIVGSNHFYGFEKYLGNLLDKVLRKQYNIPISNTMNAGEIYLNKIISDILLIPGTIGNFFINNSKVTGAITKQINYATELELEKIKGNIVYLDIYSLIHEVIDNPTIYGIDDILLPTCTLGISAVDCNKKDNVYHADKHYMWSDWFHPSPETHKIFADYITSVFNAPLYIASISKQMEYNTELAKNILNLKLLNLKHNNSSNKFNFFINYSGEKDTKTFSFKNYNINNSLINNLNLGTAYQLNKKLLLGSMLSLSKGKYFPYKNFNYSYNNEMLNLFTQFNFNNNLWTNINLYFGIIKANNIKRSFKLLKYIRTENGSTKGYNKGIDLNLGYDFNLSNNIYLTPIVGISWDNYKIDGFQEYNQNSTSMKFTNQSRNKSIIKIGTNLSTQNYYFNTYLKINFNYAIKNDPIIINSSIKNTKTSFNREINPFGKKWFDLQTGINTKIKKNINFNANIGYRTNSNKNNQLYYFTGLNINF